MDYHRLFLPTPQPTARTNRRFGNGFIIHFLADELVKRVRIAGLHLLLAGRGVGGGQGRGRDARGPVETVGSGLPSGFGLGGARKGGWVGAVGETWDRGPWGGGGVGVAGRGVWFACALLGGAGCFERAVVRGWCSGGFGSGEEQLVELVFESAFEWADALFGVDAQLDQFLGDGVI